MSKLYFRYGAMGCGKTTHLLQVAHNYEEHDNKVFLMKPGTDTKGKTNLVSRIGLIRTVDAVLKKGDSVFDHVTDDVINTCDCVLVDEAQFLTEDQVDELHWLAQFDDIPVICYGLRTNFKLEDGGFEGATRLLQVAESIEELKTICDCGAKATVNARFVNGEITDTGDDVVIDGADSVEYKAMCYYCYEKAIRNKALLSRQSTNHY